MNKIFLLMDLMKHGQEITNKESWKKGQAYVQPILYAIVVACIQLAQAFGFQIEIDSSVLVSVAGMLFFCGNTIITLITSKHIGLPVFGKGSSTEPPVYGVVENPTVVSGADVQDIVRNAAMDIATAAVGNAAECMGEATEAVDDAAQQLARASEWLKRYGK